MNDEARLAKNLAIKEKGNETRNRHKAMRCRVIMLKVVRNKLTKEQSECLHGQFREAKWVYNSMLSQSNEGKDIFSLTYSDFETVTHKDKDKNDVISSLQFLSKRELQSVIASVKTNITNLAKAKKKGLDVGALRFISEYTSIDLPQYEKSYRIVSRTRVKVDKVKRPIYVRGLDQLYNLDCEYELANAKLVNRPDGFYIAVTIYTEREHEDGCTSEKPLIGIDMGCQTSLTLSDGRKINAEVKETERLKRLQRSLDRSEKGSNNRRRIRRKLRVEHGHLCNKRDDMARKILHMLSMYKVVMQDEQLSNWQKGGHGKKVSHGVLGRVKDGLLSRDDTYVIDKMVPTTKLCTCCGEHVEMGQWDRRFVCPCCGHEDDRDVHAAKNMLWLFGNRGALCVGRTEYTREAFQEGIRAILDGTSHETTESSVPW